MIDLTKPQYFDLAGAADYLGGGVSPRTLRRWILAGRLPAYRPGGKLLVRRADLDALVEGSRVRDLEGLVEAVLRLWEVKAPAGGPGQAGK